jgi:DNA helicase-2/ATP-dependent DNA helicase PcrA
MTRAKDRLYLSHALSRRVYGSLRFNDPSRFLDEIPEDLLDTRADPEAGGVGAEAVSSPRVIRRRARRRSAPAAGESDSEVSYDQSSGYDDETNDLAGMTLEPGTRVHHPNLGVGAVERVEGEGRRARVVVRFDRGGTRTLMLAYAELEIV